MVATEIKAPAGSVHQKYVYTCFLVNVLWSRYRSILDSFGSIWVGDNVPGRILGSLNFGFFWSNGSNLKVWKIWGMNVKMGIHLRKYKYLVKVY